MDLERPDGDRRVAETGHLPGDRHGDQLARLLDHDPAHRRQGAVARPAPSRLRVDDRPITDCRRRRAARGGRRRLDRPADLRRGREHRADGGRHPRRAAGGDAARRRRRLARRHRTAGRRAGRRRPTDPGPPSRPQAGPRPRVPRWLRARPGGRCHDHRPDGRRLQPRSGAPCPISSARSARHGRPRHRIALHAGRRGRRLGARPPGGVARRKHLRPGRPRSRAERPDRRVQGLAGQRPWRRSRSTASTPVAMSSRSR